MSEKLTLEKLIEQIKLNICGVCDVDNCLEAQRANRCLLKYLIFKMLGELEEMKEKEPLMVRYAELTPKGKRIFDKISKMEKET